MGFGQYTDSTTSGRRHTLTEARRNIPVSERLAGRGNPHTVKRLGHNRFAAYHDNGSIAYYLHTSPIVVFDAPARMLTIDLCGWPTITTRKAIMEFGRPYGVRYCWADGKRGTIVNWRGCDHHFQMDITFSTGV